MLVKDTKCLMSQQYAICFPNWSNRFGTQILSHVGNGEEVTIVTNVLKDSIDCRTLTPFKGARRGNSTSRFQLLLNLHSLLS